MGVSFSEQPWVCPRRLDGKILEIVSRACGNDGLRTQESCYRASCRSLPTLCGVLNVCLEGALTAPPTENNNNKRREETLGGDGQVYGLDLTVMISLTFNLIELYTLHSTVFYISKEGKKDKGDKQSNPHLPPPST